MDGRRMSRGAAGASRLSRRVGFILLLLVFPFPLALVYALGILLELRWPYVVTYASWTGFAVSLDHVATHGWPVRLRWAASKGVVWPHPGVVFLCVGLIFAWFLLSRIHGFLDPVLVWSVWNIIAILGYIEGAIVGSKRTDGTEAPT